MKSYLVIFAVVFAMMALTGAMVQHSAEAEDGPEGDFRPLLSRVARDKCDNRECDQLCRRLFLPGGVCVRNKCDCDKF